MNEVPLVSPVYLSSHVMLKCSEALRNDPTEDYYDALIKRHHFVLLPLQSQFKEAKTLCHVLLNYSLREDAQL